MKNILPILLLISSIGFGQNYSRLKFSQLPNAGGNLRTVITGTNGDMSFQTKVDFLHNTVKSNTLTANYLTMGLGSDSIGNSDAFYSTGVLNFPTGIRSDVISNYTGGTMSINAASGFSLNVNGSNAFNVVPGGLNASTVPYLNASRELTSSTVTPTELNLLGGVTDPLATTIGTQTLTNKSLTSPTLTGVTTQSTTNFNGVVNQYSATAASSSTVDLSTVNGNYIHITGTTTINSFGTVQAGAKREITFDGSLTLTSNTLSLILPGNTSIQTAANDVATFVSEGGGNWRCMSYMRNDESYTNYTPTWTGFTAAPTIAAGEARYKMLTKNTCQVIIYPSVSGTSNATTTTVTLPFAAYNAGTFGLQAYCIPVLNNGAMALGSARTTSGSNVLNLYNGAIGGATWTAGGVAKSAYITIVYQID